MGYRRRGRRRSVPFPTPPQFGGSGPRPPPPPRPPARWVARASRSGRAHPTYPRSRVLGECRSLSTACPPSPSQRTCSQDHSRCGRGEGHREPGQAAACQPAPGAHTRAPCPPPGPFPVNPPATLPLGTAHHCHQHWGREDAKKPSSRKAPHPSAAPRHGGGGAPPPSRPAAGAAPAAAAAAAAALAPSGGGRRGRGRGEEERERGEEEQRARERWEGEETASPRPSPPRRAPGPPPHWPRPVALALRALARLGCYGAGP